MDTDFGQRMKKERDRLGWSLETAAREGSRFFAPHRPLTIRMVRTIELTEHEEDITNVLGVVALLRAYESNVSTVAPLIAGERELLTLLLDPSRCFIGTAA